MEPIRRVLVAVKNPELRRQRGVEKALHIAKQIGARVELFHAISTPVFVDVEPYGSRTLAEIKRQSLERQHARLDRMAGQARKRGIEVSCHVAWDFPPHEAIVRRADHVHSDLIIAECHHGRRLKPWLMHVTDWELLRLSTRPVLLLKNARPWRKPLLLAAVDPSHAHAKPARLDSDIVAHARALARPLVGSLELMHANFPPAFGALLGDSMLDAGTLASLYDLQKKQSMASFQAFARKARVPEAGRHLVDADPVFAIPQMARKLGADLVVMGAVSRSGLRRVFIGNTAERVLEALPCDVLVIKPRRFGKHVRGKSRGMRIVPPEPLMPLPV